MQENDRKIQKVLAKLSSSLAIGSITMCVSYEPLRMTQHQNLAQQTQASLFSIYSDYRQFP